MPQGPADSMSVLNRLLSLLVRSLPMYLAEAGMYARPERTPAVAVLENVVADQRALIERITELIDQRRGQIELAPQEDRTALNFLDVDYLLPLVKRQQTLDIAALEQCVRDLAGDAQARALAEEALGSARAHLEALEEALRNATAGAAK